MKISILFPLLLLLAATAFITPHFIKEKEVITVYTPQDIYFLEGTTITTESNSRFSISKTRAEAIEILSQWTADDCNQPIHLVTLTENGACTYEIFAPDYLIDKIEIDDIYYDERGPYPMDVAIWLTDSLQIKYRPLMYDY